MPETAIAVFSQSLGKRWARASTAPNKKRLALCLRGPSFPLLRPRKTPRPSGGFSGPWESGEERRWGRGGVSNRPPYEECSTKRGYSSMINPWGSQNGRMHRHRCGDADSATSRLTSTDLPMEGHGDPRRIDDDLRASLCLVAPWFFVGFGSLGGSPRN